MLRIAICDNDTRDLYHLEKIIMEVMDSLAAEYCIHSFDSINKLLDSAIGFQLIFSEVVFGDINGIEVGKRLYHKNATAKIIFQSRFGQYFKEALNSSHAFAFLEKPIAKTPVKQQVKDFLAINQPARDDRMEFTSVSCEMEGRSFKKINLTFSLRKIEYFEYMKTIKKVRIVTDNGNFTFSDTMRALEERMKPYGFEMSSRGILVNLDKIVEIKGSSIVLESGAELPLSQKRIVDFRERMGGHIQSSF